MDILTLLVTVAMLVVTTVVIGALAVTVLFGYNQKYYKWTIPERIASVGIGYCLVLAWVDIIPAILELIGG